MLPQRWLGDTVGTDAPGDLGMGNTNRREVGYVYLGMSPSQKSVARLRGKVEDLMKSGNVMPWPEVRDRLNATLRGWFHYFGQGDCYPAYRAVNHYVYERVRVFLRRRHKVSSLGTAQFSDRVVFGKLGVLRLFVAKKTSVS
jgi:RNA-directed DNA polymerase